MWLMIGLALVILGIILVTGRTTPPVRSAAAPRTTDPTLLSPERIQAYQRQLTDDEARLRAELARASVDPAPASRSTAATGHVAPPSDPVADEQRRRDYQSLFADNVAFSRRSGETVANRAASPGTPIPAPSQPATTTPPPAPETATAHKDTDPIRSSDVQQRLLEGTVIETVLINRLNGTFAGPVECLVTTPVYAHDRQQIVIPAGARVLGQAAPVQAWGDSRLAVSFHRLALPDGRTYSLDQFKGLNQIGETGLRDQVNRHYLQVFGASLAIGAISGLAQYGTSGGYASAEFSDQYRQAAGASLAASAARVLDRYLNVLPTITIREGYRIKVYLTNDLELPAYTSTDTGGGQ